MKSKEKKVEEENSVYLRFDYSEALESKRKILYLQKGLMEINKSMREKFSLEEKSIELKKILHKKLKEELNIIKNLQKSMPKAEVPKILKKDEDNKGKSIGKNKIQLSQKKAPYDDSIESQLQEIQEKLRNLGS